MHKKLIAEASDEVLRSFTYDIFDDLKEKYRDMYDELEMRLYEEIYGEHFNSWMLDKALSCMQNEDGTTGGHFRLEQTNNLAKNMGISYDYFNEYDWNYVVNMMYSDYYGVVSDDIMMYGKLAKKFLYDKDAKKGKAFYYYISMKN